MGAVTVPTKKQISENETTNSNNSTCMKLIQLWLTSFAIGIPSLRLLFFFDFRNSEIIIAVFLTLLIFGTMYILDDNDRLSRDDEDHSTYNVVTDGDSNVNISSNYRNKKFETIVDTRAGSLPLMMTKTNKSDATMI